MNEAEGKHGVQSIEIGMQVLRAVAGGNRAMMLKDIAAAAGMPASKAHRYLVSLIRAGMVEQDRESSLYDLGPLALHVGLAAIDRLDRVQLGLNAIADLRDRVNETTALSVWSENGPIIVRDERPRRAITVNVVTGTALDVLSSASGQIFAAYLPREKTQKLIEAELADGRAPAATSDWPAIEAMFERVRATGISSVSGYHLVPGVEAIGAPVFNAAGTITLTMLVVGIQGMFDMRPDGPIARQLVAAANTLSERLGSRRRIIG